MIYLVNNKINSQNHLTNKGLYLQKFGTKSVQSRYTVSGILERSEIRKSPNTNCIKAFECGADETRTRDLLRDRQAF